MRLWKGFKDIIYKSDFFYTAEMLRYQNQPEYRTLFGGVLSLTIIITLIIAFYTIIGNTLNKVIIITSTSYSNLADPLSYNITTQDGSYFMLGIQIWHLNLNEGKRIFDVVLMNNEFATGEDVLNNSIQYPLEPCTLDHWKPFPQIQEDFTRLNMKKWMCLPLNTAYEIKGKYASQISKTLKIDIRKCSNTSIYNTRECESPENISKFFDSGKQYFTIYFINPLINPGSQQYLSYYLQDNNFIIFTQNFGAQATLFMQGFQIETDQSIWPLKSMKNQAGSVITEFAIQNFYNVLQNDTSYCSFSFFKSGIETKYQRSFSKLDETLAYIGGLFGTISMLLLIVSVYNGYSFEINICSYLFQGQSKENTQTLRKYNFLYFLAHLFYTLLGIFGFKPNWKTVRQYYNCREEMLKQLDILYLLKRVLFLEKSIQMIFDQHELNSLYFHEKMSFYDAAKKRKKHKLSKIFMKNKQKNKGILSESSSLQNKSIVLETLNEMNFDVLVRKQSNRIEQLLQNGQISEANQIINDRPIMPQKRVYPEKKYIKQSKKEQEEDLSSSDSEVEQQKEDHEASLVKLKEQSQRCRNQGRKVKIWATIDVNIKKQVQRIYQHNNLIKYAQNIKQQYQINRQETMVQQNKQNNESQSIINHQNSQLINLQRSQQNLNRQNSLLNQHQRTEQIINRKNSAFLPSQIDQKYLKLQNKTFRYQKANPKQILLNNRNLDMQYFQEVQ